MKDSSKRAISLNPTHWQNAKTAAEWVVRSDNRLIGIPRYRPEIARIAARQAMGSPFGMPKAFYLEVHDPRTLDAVHDTLSKARDAAIAKLTELPPLRTSGKMQEVVNAD